MGNLPKAIQPEWENKSLYFWVPAFKLQPKIFLRLSTQFVISQPDPFLEKKSICPSPCPQQKQPKA